MGERMHDLFGPGSNQKGRIMTDYEELGGRVAACRSLGIRIVLTSGTYDLWHEGHARYLEAARGRGDLLIVGVDEDTKVRNRKGEGRPLVGEQERMEILCHSRHVDLVFLKKLGDPKWQLIKTVRPDVLIATEATYTGEQLRDLEEFCGEVVALPPQSATSTTARIRLFLITTVGRVREDLEAARNAAKRGVDESFEGILRSLDDILHGRR